MKFNVSHVRAHLECPQKAYNQYILGREPVGRPVALELGALWHLGMESYLKSKDKTEAHDDVIVELAKKCKEPNYPKLASGWAAIEPAFMHWSTSDDWEILAVEKLVEHKFGAPYELIIQGRLDGLVKWAGNYWHLQHKTLSPSTPLSVYFAYMQRDWHECWYEFACREAGYTPYGGTILNVCRKLSAKTIAENPSAAISIQYIPRPIEIVRKAMFDLEIIGAEIYNQKDFPFSVMQNRSMCAGRFGNSLCPYIDVCNGLTQISNTELFKDVEARYEEGEVPLEPLQ